MPIQQIQCPCSLWPIATTSDATTSLGGYIHGLHHQFTSLGYQDRHLDSSWPIHQVCSFCSITYSLHCGTTCLCVHLRNPSPWLLAVHIIHKLMGKLKFLTAALRRICAVLLAKNLSNGQGSFHWLKSGTIRPITLLLGWLRLKLSMVVLHHLSQITLWDHPLLPHLMLCRLNAAKHWSCSNITLQGQAITWFNKQIQIEKTRNFLRGIGYTWNFNHIVKSPFTVEFHKN